jgi:hypothetical protein
VAIQKIKFKKYAKNIVVINWIATLRAKLSLAMTVEEPVWIATLRAKLSLAMTVEEPVWIATLRAKLSFAMTVRASNDGFS